MKLLLVLVLCIGNAFAMNKAELIYAMAKSSGIEKGQIKRGFRAMTKNIAENMKKGNNVSIVGFGTFIPYSEEKKKKNKTKVKHSSRYIKPLTPRYTDSFFKTL